eukprot:Gb_25543 [translate_table: standard]
MVLETWLTWMGNHVRNTFKTAVKKTTLDPRNKKSKSDKAIIGVLALEVANLMSKTVQLWQSLNDEEVIRLRTEVITLEGVRKIVSNDEDFLLGLACAEKLDNLTILAEAVARLGKRCQDPALQGFEHVYDDLICHNIDVRALVFSVKDMEGKIKKMEKYISATTNLYQELEVLADLEQTLRRMQGGDEGNRLKDSLHSVQQKVIWQRQETKYLREISLWNRTYDGIAGLLARTIFTIYGRIRSVFGVMHLDLFPRNGNLNQFPATFDSFPRSFSVSASGPYLSERKEIRYSSGPLERCPIELNSGRRSGPVLNRIGSNKVWQDRDRLTVGSVQSFVSENNRLMMRSSNSPSGFFKESQNLNLNGYCPVKLQNSLDIESSNAFASNCKLAESSCNLNTGNKQKQMAAGQQSANGPYCVSTSGNVFPQKHIRQLQSSPSYHSGTHSTRSFIGSKCKLLNAPPSTLGGAALALHYANVIIIIEKLVRFPHLIGPDARDDLYQMLPTSVRTALRARLKSYAKNMASTMYDAALAADWNDALGRILEWLAPLAHDMIRWQSDRNFEQQHLVSRTNVLLLQTLYFANQEKTEVAITELLVGLNYICRYEQEIRANALMECTSNHDYDEYLEWQL